MSFKNELDKFIEITRREIWKDFQKNSTNEAFLKARDSVKAAETEFEASLRKRFNLSEEAFAQLDEYFEQKHSS